MRLSGLGFTKPPAGSQINWGHPLTRNLIGCWLFNENNGNFVNDLVRNKNGTLIGPSWNNSNISFDGSNDYMTILNLTDQVSNTQYSWIIGIKPKNISAVQDTVTGTDISGPGSTYSPIIQVQNNKFRHYLWDGGAKSVVGNTTIVLNNKYIVAATAKDNNVMDLYVNGQKDNASVSFGTSYKALDRIWIGYPVPTDSYFTGELGFFYIYSYKLTPAEIYWLYEEPYCFILPPSRSVRFYVPSTLTYTYPTYQKSLLGVGF